MANFANGTITYSINFNSSLVAIPSASSTYLQEYSYVSATLWLSSSGIPTTFVMQYYTNPISTWKISSFSQNPLNSFQDGDFAPPPDSCIVPTHACPGTFPTVTLDAYRAHDNSSFAHVLENANVATSAGECYFACIGNAGPYVTHFQIRLTTKWK